MLIFCLTKATCEELCKNLKAFSSPAIRHRHRQLLGLHPHRRCPADTGGVPFHLLGYTTIEIALLFLFYEFFGVVANLYGGWIGARYGLRLTLWVGTLLQILALLMLIPVAAGWPKLFSVVYVMAA